MKLEFIVKNEKIHSKIKRLLEGFDFKAPIEEAVNLLKDEAVQNIEQQGAIYTGKGFVREGGAFANQSTATTKYKPWQPLAPSTRKERAYLIATKQVTGITPSRPILVRTQKLKNSFKSYVTSGNKGVVTNTVSYAKTHQFGDPAHNVPQRTILGISNKSGMAIKVIFQNYINKFKS